MVMGAQRARTLTRPQSTSATASRCGQLRCGQPGRPAPSRPAPTGSTSSGPRWPAYGMTTSLITPAGRVPSLRVVNPAAPALAEDVYAGCCEDGSWWFWWSWAERIAAASDLDQAAARIAHVLAAPHAG